MPLVFVHGVNVRADGDYAGAVAFRDELFCRVSFAHIVPGAGLQVSNPYWGDFGCTFPFNHGYIPSGATETFGTSADSPQGRLLDQAVLIHPPFTITSANGSIADLAKVSLDASIDSLCIAVLASGIQPLNAKALAEFSIRAHEYAAQNPVPGWLSNTTSNTLFVDQLVYAVCNDRKVESFGSVGSLGASLKTASLVLGQRLANRVLDTVAPAAKRQVLLRFARFFGDVFCYINEAKRAPSDQKIRSTVEAAIRDADKRRTPQDGKLVVVGHSMGGNIAYDLLTSSLKDVSCDLFLTVGSQVGLFEELKLFASSDSSVPKPAIPKVRLPSNMKAWLNVYDPSDPFGYATKGIFEGTWDFEFDTKADPLSAHSAYFYRPGFHRRLAERLREVI